MINIQSIFINKDTNNFRGLGKAVINKILTVLTPEEVILHIEGKETKALRHSGLTAKQVRTLYAGYAAYKPLFDIAKFLDGNGFTLPIAHKAFIFLGPQCLKMVNQNPYRLLAFSSWEEVDKLGLRRGTEFHPCRLVAAIQNCVYVEYEEEKHTYIKTPDLFRKVSALIGCDRNCFNEGLKLAISVGAIVEYMGYFQAPAVHMFEREIDSVLHGKNALTGISKVSIEHFLNGNPSWGLLTDQQHAAVINSLTHRFSAFSGKSGRGKTYTLSAIVNGAELLLNKKIILAAVTHKASIEMARKTDRPSCTIAKLIHATSEAELTNSFIAIDEASMLSLSDLFHLIKKLPATANIVFLGDHNQIPSIGAGRVFYDIIFYSSIPHIELTTNMRQDQKIEQQLNQILSGEFPCFDNFSNGVATGIYRIKSNNIDKAQIDAVNLYLNLYSKGEDVQILSPLYNYSGGSQAINSMVNSVRSGSKDFCEGTPIVWTKNTRVAWGVKLTNSSFGSVRVRLEGDRDYCLKVYFEDKKEEIGLTSEEVRDHLEMAYCLTVHRAQGSEWRNVIVVLPKSDRMINRNLIYSALSRCSHRAIVIYQDHDFIANGVKAAPAHEQRRSLLFQGEGYERKQLHSK